MQNNINEESLPKEENIQTEEPKVTEQETYIPLPEEPKKKNKPLLVPILVILLLFLLAGIAYATNYFIGLNNSEDVLENEEMELVTEPEVVDVEFEEEEEEIVTTYSEYSGKYIQAKIPDGWTITEYEDGKGEDLLIVGGIEYIGLTGLSILTDKDEEILQMRAIDGIGGAVLCYDINKFDDTPQSYIDTLLTDYPDCVQSTNHIAEGEYTSLSFIDYRGRRVGTKIYWNDLGNTNTNEFHPFPETAFSNILNFETLTFECDNLGIPGNGYSCETYKVKINENAVEKDLLILDEIMSSVVLKN